jgi:hypothetical protein
MFNDINKPLSESKRPPLYTSMKYWGKKPHNIWNKYISNYTINKGVYLDPFTGSAMSAFEAVRAGKKAIATDLNPLSSFLIEVVCSDFDFKEFSIVANSIISKIKNNNIYNKLYKYHSDFKDYTIHNIKWFEEKIYEVCIEDDEKNRKCLAPTLQDYKCVKEFNFPLNLVYPNKNFRSSNSFSKQFLTKIGNNFSDLWTKRNLYVLAIIFDEIIKINNNNIKKQLLYAFIQSVHLTTKMCVPRSKHTNRDFSTSWGRSAFFYSKKTMEMNPLLVFTNNCFGKQSVSSTLIFAKKYFGFLPKIANLNNETFNAKKNVDIWYGVIDAKKIESFLPPKSIDFILTDPPYGGLVKYLDLSSIWLSWLEIYNSQFTPNYENEITFNKLNDYSDFQSNLEIALRNFNYLLKDESSLMLTFNSKDLKLWTAFYTSIINSGFKVEHILHQQNLRTGESNVLDPSGQSASDFYIRCSKSKKEYKKSNPKTKKGIVYFKRIITDILIKRGEPTPYNILLNGFLSRISTKLIEIDEISGSLEKNIKKFMKNDVLIIKNVESKSGDFYLLKSSNYDLLSKDNLINKTKKYIRFIFKKLDKIDNETLYLKIYQKFNNELALDPITLKKVLSKVCYKKSNYWYLINEE